MSGSSFFGFLNTIADKNKELMEINDNGLEFISNLKKTKESYEKLMTPYNKMEKDITSFTEAVTKLQNEKACSILNEPKENNSGFFSLFSSSKPKEEENTPTQEPIPAPSLFGTEPPAESIMPPLEEKSQPSVLFGKEKEETMPSPFGAVTPLQFGTETPSPFSARRKRRRKRRRKTIFLYNRTFSTRNTISIFVWNN